MHTHEWYCISSVSRFIKRKRKEGKKLTYRLSRLQVKKANKPFFFLKERENFTSYSDALSDCDLDSLYDRRVEHCLRFAEGLSKSSRTNELLPPVQRDVHGSNLRNADKLTQLFCQNIVVSKKPHPLFHQFIK